jgi:uncharacterized protein (DUF885 family)
MHHLALVFLFIYTLGEHPIGGGFDMAYLWFLLLIPMGLLAWLVYSSFWGRPVSIQILFERYFLKYALKSPELLTHLGLLEKFGIRGHNSRLDDVSIGFLKKQMLITKRDLAFLRSYDLSRLSAGQLLSARIMEWFLEDEVKSEPFMFHNYPLNQMFGVQSEFPNFMTTIHRVDSLRGALDYIERLRKVRVKFNQVMEGLKFREHKGILPPRFVIQRVLTEMRQFASLPPKRNVLYTVFTEKLRKLKLSKKREKELLVKAEKAIEDSVYPAYQMLMDHFTALEKDATTDDGVWKLPNGEKCYVLALRTATTTDYSPEKVHAVGLAEVKRIEEEMKIILKKLGLEHSNPCATLERLGRVRRFLYPNTEKGRKQALKDYQSIIDHIDRNLDGLFDKRPRAGVRVERIPSFREKTSALAYYHSPSMDGKRPGVFYANLRDMKEVVKWGMKTNAYHEAIPGHHFQIALAMEIKKVPIFRRLLPFYAYVEGWALYAEKLARENGFLGDPYSELGYLQAEILRAVRLVVDTGIHHKRWTRSQAIAYMLKHTGMPEPSVISEVERYIVMPGQACAYKIGELKILELRTKARRLLGSKFDIRKFHNVILQNGAMPLSVLENVVDQFIKTQKEV